jgi:hypothetical protein
MFHLLAAVFSVSVALAADGMPRAATPSPLAPDLLQALIGAPTRRVRALDPRIASVLAEGLARSPTLGRLVAALEFTDVIVQIVATQNLPAAVPGRLLLVPGAKAYRYLRIQIRPEGSTDDLIGTLAHELQHAHEVAHATDVRDDDGMARLYRRIGFRGPGEGEYDTVEAHDVALRVRRELWYGTPSSRP